MADMPSKISEALQHVRSFHPEVTQVTFAQEDTDCGGFWTYANDSGEAPVFDERIDVSLLEEALDAAWEDRAFPATYRA